MNEVPLAVLKAFERGLIAGHVCELCGLVIGKESADTAVMGPRRTPVHKECWEKYANQTQG